jgi:ATP-dependent DNA helicase 2 subunit 1
MAEDTARSVEKAEIRKAFKFGGETVSFTEDEMAKIRNFGDPVLRIVGFKPMEVLPIWANLKHNTFIYPSEEEYVGSTRVFSALQQKLLKDNLFGLAWFIPRRNAVPTLAAVYAGAEKRTDEGEQVMPPGLWVKLLPFADDVREPPETHSIKAPDELIDSMRVIVQQLQLPKAVYDPTKYPNPSLQWFYKILQALALEEDLPESPEDKTQPRWRQIHNRAGKYVVDFGEVLDRQFAMWQQANQANIHPTANGGAKRSQAASSGGTKRVKKENEDDDDDALTEDDVRRAYKNNVVKKFKNDQLKKFLVSKGLKGTGKKDDLVSAVESYFESKMETD